MVLFFWNDRNPLKRNLMWAQWVRKMGNVFLRGGLVLVLHGCGAPPPMTQGAAYLTQDPLEIAVQTVHVHDDSSPVPNNDTIIRSVSLPHMVRQWAQDAWLPKGHKGRLNITIQAADVQEKFLPVDMSVARLWKYQMPEQYSGTLTVRLVYDNGFGRQASARIQVHADKPLSEQYTVAERRIALVGLYEDMLNRVHVQAAQWVRSLSADGSSGGR